MEKEFNPIILEKLKNKFKFVEFKNQKILLGNSLHSNGEIMSEYECVITGAFTKERGQEIQISDMGTIEWNAIGLLCSFYPIPYITENERKLLSAAQSQTEANQIFEKILGEEYIFRNVFYNPQELVDNAINIVIGENSYDIYYAYGTKKLKLAGFVNNQNNVVYRMLLKELKAKNFFESVIVNELSLHGMSPENLLKLFAVYRYKMHAKLIDME